MKKMIILEAVLLIGAFIVPTDIGVYMIMLAIVLPFVIIITKGIIKQKKDKAVVPVTVAEPEKPAEPAVTKKTTEDTEKTRNKPKPYTKLIYLYDGEEAERFFKAYRHDMDEDDDYFLSNKELKEDFYDNVYRYFPYQLPFKIENERDVYSWISEDEWIFIGKVSRQDLQYLNDSKYQQLFLYANIYKYVTDENVEKIEDDPFFALKVRVEPTEHTEQI